jgi:hypothetical protein
MKDEKEPGKCTGSHKWAATLTASVSVHHQLKREQEIEGSGLIHMAVKEDSNT